MRAIETRKRVWAKSLIWRILGIFIFGFISWLITKDWKEMSLITVLFHGIRIVLYYIHERIWERIGWGRIKHPLSHLPINRPLSPEDMQLISNQLKKLGYID